MHIRYALYKITCNAAPLLINCPVLSPFPNPPEMDVWISEVRLWYQCSIIICVVLHFTIGVLPRTI